MADRWPPGHCYSAGSASAKHRGPDALNSHIQASTPMVFASCSVIAAFGSAANAQPLRMIHGKNEIADSSPSLRIKQTPIPSRAGRPLAKVSDPFHKNFGRPVAGLNFQATLQFLFR